MSVYSTFSRVQRQGEYGIFMKELLSNAAGTVLVNKYSLVRVRALTDGTTVTIDGVLSVTMAAGEVVHLNAGQGNPESQTQMVTVVVNNACYLQTNIEKRSEYAPNAYTTNQLM